MKMILTSRLIDILSKIDPPKHIGEKLVVPFIPRDGDCYIEYFWLEAVFDETEGEIVWALHLKSRKTYQKGEKVLKT